MSQAAGAVERGSWADRVSAKALGPLLFALRLWASVCLALYVAFALELSDPSWAGTTAALVCQPQLGASLRKGSFRLMGTAAGGAAIVVIAALFPQDRVGFLTGLALWSAVCGFVAGLLKNFAAYGAGLAAFTAAVIAGDVFSPSGGANDQVVVTLAITRMIEIALGIVSAGVVLALTDLGAARRRLGVEFASIAAAALSGLSGAIAAAEPLEPATRAARREVMRRVIALDPMIDTALGEASDLRARSRILQAGVGGLIATISAWRTIAIHLGAHPRTENDESAAAAAAILQRLATTPQNAERDPAGMRDACDAAARSAVRIEARSPSSQLLATAVAAGAIGAALAFNGLTLVVDPRRTRREDALARLHIPDWLPPTVVAARAFMTAALVSLLWIATAWSSGPLALTFAIIVAALFPLQGERAYSAALIFLFGCVLSAALAAILMFGVLPAVSTFPGLCLALGLVLVPLGVLIAWPWQPVFFTAAAINLIPFLSLKNLTTYDPEQFANTVVAILAGMAVGTILIRLIPPPSAATRTRRLLRFALADVRGLAAGRGTQSRRVWVDRMVARIVAVPDAAEPVERATMASALAVGMQVIRLRRIARRFTSEAAIDAALRPLAEGRVTDALAGLEALDRALTAVGPETRIVCRLRAVVLALSEELAAFPEFYDERGRG
jgi:uncharacterized membrane protein YccC